jgi:hypothetical protein
MAIDETTDTAPDTATPEPGEFDVTTLRNLESFDDAVALLTDTYGELQDATKVIGSGFALTDTNGKYRLIGEPELTEPLDSAARDCDFTEFFVSDVRLAAVLGPEAASNNPAAIATM